MPFLNHGKNLNVTVKNSESHIHCFCFQGKMRHLLELLCKDFKEPDKTVSWFTDLDKNDHCLLNVFHPHFGSLDRQERTKESSELFSSDSISRCDSPDYPSNLSASTLTCSPERSASPAETTGQDGEDGKLPRSPGSSQLSDHLSSNAQGSIEQVHHNQTGAAATSEVDSENQDLESVTSDKGVREELGGGDFERHCDKTKDLETKLYEMHLETSETGHSSPDKDEERTASSASDDDF